jgi:hypothetical protein
MDCKQPVTTGSYPWYQQKNGRHGAEELICPARGFTDKNCAAKKNRLPVGSRFL